MLLLLTIFGDLCDFLGDNDAYQINHVLDVNNTQKTCRAHYWGLILIGFVQLRT